MLSNRKELDTVGYSRTNVINCLTARGVDLDSVEDARCNGIVVNTGRNGAVIRQL